MNTTGTDTRATILAEDLTTMSYGFKASAAIRKGALVKLVAATGKIAEVGVADTQDVVIGVALKDAITDDEIAVRLRGYTIVEGCASASSQTATTVSQGTWYSTKSRFLFATAVVGTNPVHGWQLAPSTNQYDYIPVLIKN